MRIGTLSPATNSRKPRHRVGRGISAGQGKTSGKGMKGQNSRSGGGVRTGFEGGQMTLVRRLPKVGFTNKFKKVYSLVNVEQLNVFDDNTTVNAELLLKNGIISKIEKNGLKILGNGDLTKILTIQANKFSASAIDKIKKAGGTFEVL